MAKRTSRSRKSRLRLAAVIAALAVGIVAALAGGAFASSGSSIASDQLVYSPGGTVTLAGGGWVAGDNIHLYVNDSSGNTWSYNADVTADANGNVENQFSLPSSFVSTYSVTAADTTNGTDSASYTFYDDSLVLTPATTTLTAGGNQTFSFSSYNGNGCGTSSGPSSGVTSHSWSVSPSSGTTINSSTVSSANITFNTASATAYTVTLTWNGTASNGHACSAVGNSSVTVNSPALTSTAISAVSGSGTYGSTASLMATLKAGTTLLNNRQIDFSLNGTSVGHANTNASGVATLSGVSLSGINAGSHTGYVIASFAGDSTYAASGPTSGDLSVAKADPTCSVTPYSVTYNGNAHTATGSCTGVGGATDTLSGLDLTGTTHTNAGDYTGDTWSFPTTTNYNSAGATIEDKIAKADPTCSVTPYSVTYNGNAHTATGSCTGVGGATDTLSGLDLTGTTHTNAGDYTGDTWSFPTTTNYNSAGATIEDKIAKADPTCSVTPYSVTYNGNAHTATGSCTGVGGATDTLSGLDLTGTTHTNAGDYTGDTWSFPTTTNYNSAGATIEDKIAKADQTIIFTSNPPASPVVGTTYTPTATGGGSGNLVLFSASGGCSYDPLTGKVTLNTPASICLVMADQAGNGNYNAAPEQTQSFTVTYNFTGFFQPVNNPTDPAPCNTVKAGSAIPVKFSLGGYQGMGILASGSPNWTTGSCTGTDDAITSTETVNAGNSSLNYDATSNQYIYVWKTDKTWAGKSMRLTVTLADGTSHYARFSFTK